MKKILFIDRDGTIVEEPHDEQVDDLSKIRFKPGVFRWLAFLREKTDFHFVMVSNQDGLGTPAFPEDTFWPSQNFILNALKGEGIENILALRGDPNPNVPAKNDFRHSSDLISYLKGSDDFCFLGACYPECHPESSSVITEIKSLKKKVDAGAEVLLSQLFFDNEIFYRFHEECRIADIDVPVIPGVMPVINAAQIKRMVSLCHASFPARFQKIISRYEDNKEALFDAGMSYCLSQIIDLLVSDISGIHLYTMNNPLVARRICEGIKNIV